MITRNEALEVLKNHVKGESLIKHSLAVEAAMRGYAKIYNEDVERFGITGLLHDVDFEKYPEEHPSHARALLEGLGLDDEMLDAIVLHGKAGDVNRETLIAKVLYAVDSLSSFIIAYVLVRPDQSFEGIKLKSINKKFKDKAFARAVSREYIIEGAESLDLELSVHMTNVIDAVVIRQSELLLVGESLV